MAIVNINNKIDELESEAIIIEEKFKEVVDNTPLFYKPTPPGVITSLGNYHWDDPTESIKKIQRDSYRLYQNWYSSSLQLIKRYLPEERVNEFIEYYSLVLDYLKLNDIRYDSNKDKVTNEFVDIFDMQRGILNSIKFSIEDDDEIFELENEELEVDEKLCFVLMPFDDKFNSIYENIIKKIVEDDEFELNCKRADEIFGTRPIMDDVWEYIKKARILVAELTGRNPNVFYELGLAHAMNKDVILITQNLEDVPFDLKHYRCIVYENFTSGPQNLKDKLKNTLRNELSK